MAVKPDIDDTRWAETGAGVKNTGEIVEPSSGKKDIGWADAELPPHEYFNQWQNAAHEQFKYLDEGELDVVELFRATAEPLDFHASAFTEDTGAWEYSAAVATAGEWVSVAVADATLDLHLPFRPGDFLVTASVWYDRDGEEIRGDIVRIEKSTGTVTSLDNLSNNASTGRSELQILALGDPDIGIEAGYWYVLRIRGGVSNPGVTVYRAAITWNHPR
jgi:hypothetical protein